MIPTNTCSCINVDNQPTTQWLLYIITIVLQIMVTQNNVSVLITMINDQLTNKVSCLDVLFFFVL